MRAIAISLLLSFAIALPASPDNSTEQSLHTVSPICHFQRSWMQPRILFLNVEDCRLALQSFLLADGARFGHKPYMLSHPSDKPDKRDPTRTPREYTHRTCRITVGMRYTFEDERIRYAPPLGGASRDSTTYEELGKAMRSVYSECTNSAHHFGNAGWVPVGRTYSIGVFFWAVGSPIDRHVWRTGYGEDMSSPPSDVSVTTRE